MKSEDQLKIYELKLCVNTQSQMKCLLIQECAKFI